MTLRIIDPQATLQASRALRERLQLDTWDVCERPIAVGMLSAVENMLWFGRTVEGPRGLWLCAAETVYDAARLAGLVPTIPLSPEPACPGCEASWRCLLVCQS